MLISHAGVLLPDDKHPPANEIAWFVPTEGKAIVQFDICFLPPGTTSGWPGQRASGTSPIGRLDLKQETVWVVAQETDEVPDLSETRGSVPTLEGESREEAVARILGEPPYAGWRVLVHGRGTDDTRWLYETALQVNETAEGPATAGA